KFYNNLFFNILIFSIISAYRITRDAKKENILVEADNTESTLRQVNLVIRHGERSPQTTYTNDPYKNDPMEPFGWGQLTSNGRIGQYNQGLFLRERYGHFLGTKYSPEIFWLQSTAADRAKMSALLEAAALWKPDGDQAFISGLDWQPASLNYQTSDKDNLLLIWSTCPDYARMREAVEKSPEIQEINEINQNLYKELSKYTGDNITNPDDVFDLYSTLVAEKTMNYQLPNWTNEYFPDMLKPLSSLSLKMNVYNESLLKMKGGPLVSKIAHSMLDRAQSTKPYKRKMFMYVGHDSTIVNLLEGLKVWDMQIPGYSIMTMVELHENELEGYNVQIYLRNSTQHEPYPLTIPGCDFACPLDQFTQLLKPMIMTDGEWKAECVLKDPNYVPGTEPLP
ncbi:hypothetical protein TSAR_012990, partial [Trichomalopsis sarcophagae]